MNPYKVLGISPDASDDEVKKAYKTLCKKYHPDANINNPDKEKIEELFKQVQQAYQMIMKQRTSGSTYGASGSYRQEQTGRYTSGTGGSGDFFGDFWNMFGDFGGFQSTYQESSPDYRDVVRFIQNGYYKEARVVLDNMADRGGRWDFFSAQAHNGLGNKMTAIEHAKMAVAFEPDNQNYRILFSMIENGSTWYEGRSRQYSSPAYGGGSFCLKLCLLNLMCNFCCGSGGFCCGAPYSSGSGPVV